MPKTLEWIGFARINMASIAVVAHGDGKGNENETEVQFHGMYQVTPRASPQGQATFAVVPAATGAD
ncbi:hypothetical protein [Tritonibacter horizontis]|uniref:hypothetical protein n=1 Tax=Tritonibacter horizontis TaxID=1768241 RepID=UPI0010427BD8|nr:hypothetical protein [Tritonibacter horizontis]